MKLRPEFVKMPTGRITNQDDCVLRELSWRGTNRSDGIAALMLYIVFCHHMSGRGYEQFDEPGLARLSYTQMQNITSLSRPKISGGLKKLCTLNLIDIDKSAKTSLYLVLNFDPSMKWAKLPFKYLYNSNFSEIRFFRDLKLRSKVELNALKLYLLIIAFRDNTLNHARIAYPKIHDYCGIAQNDIRPAISFLVTHKLINVDRDPSENDDQKIHNLYRVSGISNRRHLGNMNPDDVKQGLYAIP